MKKINKISTQQDKELFTFYKQNQNDISLINNQPNEQQIQIQPRQSKKKNKKKSKCLIRAETKKQCNNSQVKTKQSSKINSKQRCYQKKLKQSNNVSRKKLSKQKLSYKKIQNQIKFQQQKKKVRESFKTSSNNNNLNEQVKINFDNKKQIVCKQSFRKQHFSQTKMMIKPFEYDQQYEEYQYENQSYIQNPQHCINNNFEQAIKQNQVLFDVKNNISQKFLQNIFRCNQKCYISKNQSKNQTKDQSKLNQKVFSLFQAKKEKLFYEDKIVTFSTQKDLIPTPGKNDNISPDTSSFNSNQIKDNNRMKKALNSRLVRMKTQGCHPTNNKIFDKSKNYQNLRKYIEQLSIDGYSRIKGNIYQQKDNYLPNHKSSFTVHEVIKHYHKKIQQTQNMVQYYRKIKKNTSNPLKYSLIKNSDNSTQHFLNISGQNSLPLKFHKKRSITQQNQNIQMDNSDSSLNTFKQIRFPNQQKQFQLKSNNKKIRFRRSQKQKVKLPNISKAIGLKQKLKDKNKNCSHLKLIQQKFQSWRTNQQNCAEQVQQKINNNSKSIQQADQIFGQCSTIKKQKSIQNNDLMVNFYKKNTNKKLESKQDLKKRANLYKFSVSDAVQTKFDIIYEKIQTQNISKQSNQKISNDDFQSQSNWLKKKSSSSKILNSFHHKYYKIQQVDISRNQIISMLDMNQNCIFNGKSSFDWQIKKKQIAKKYKFKI